MGKRPGAKFAAVERLNTLMATGQKRSLAKAEARLRGESLFAFTDQRIHAFTYLSLCAPAAQSFSKRRSGMPSVNPRRDKEI